MGVYLMDHLEQFQIVEKAYEIATWSYIIIYVLITAIWVYPDLLRLELVTSSVKKGSTLDLGDLAIVINL